MPEFRELQPDTETNASRKALKEGVFKLLQSRGVPARSAQDLPRGVIISLHYDHTTGQPYGATVLKDFIEGQYPGRSMYIKEIEVYYRGGMTKDEGEKITQDAMAVTIQVDPVSRSDLETLKKGEVVVVSQEEKAVAPIIGLSVSEDPMTYGTMNYSLLDMIRGTVSEPVESIQPLSPSVVLDIARLIPDLPKGKEVMKYKDRFIPNPDENVFKQFLQIIREELGPTTKVEIPQGKKQITLDPVTK